MLKKPLTELYVDGSFTEDRAVWLHELQRLCEELYDNDKEMAERQKERIVKLQRVTNFARKMSELLKSQLTLCSKPGPGGQRTWWTRRFGRRGDDQGGPAREGFRDCEMLPGPLHGSGRCSQLLGDRRRKFLRKHDADPKKEIRINKRWRSRR